MPSNESMRDTLEYFRQQRTTKLEEIRQMESTIHQLERELGDEMTQFDSADAILASAEQIEKSSSAASTGHRKSDIRPDEFFGLSQPEAARRYLKRVGHAVTVDEVLDALRKGGCEVGGADPKKVLYISMVRDTRNFVRLPNSLIGLRDFYPDRNLKEKKEKKKPVRKRTKAKSAKIKHYAMEKKEEATAE